MLLGQHKAAATHADGGKLSCGRRLGQKSGRGDVAALRRAQAGLEAPTGNEGRASAAAMASDNRRRCRLGAPAEV
jgi:hypothetical protein